MALFQYYGTRAEKTDKGLYSVKASASAIEEVKAPSDSQQKSVTVYVARGQVQSIKHRAGCRHLSRSKFPISLEAAKKRYGPCSVCRPPL